jgi:hypothetical protein
MPQRKKRDTPKTGPEDTPRESAGSPRAGLPDARSVVSEAEIVSPKGRHYRVLRTVETDAYDEPPPPPPDEPEGPPPKRPGRAKARHRSGE